MEYIYATLLLHKLGKEVTEQNIKAVIEATGASTDEAKIKSLLASLKGVDIGKAMSESAMIAATPATTQAAAKPEPKEEKKAEGGGTA